MTDQGFTLFDTAIGRCAVAWGPRGVIGVHFPEPTDERTRAALARRFPEAVETHPPPVVAEAIERIAALMKGEPADLAAVPLDLERVPEFHRRVYEVARAIPPGQTATYGEIAVKLGDKRLAR